MGKNINDHESVAGTATGIPPEVPGAAFFAEPGEADAGDISALEPEALVAALDNPAKAEQAAAEVTKRLESTPKANQLAYRFLRGWSRQEAGLLTAKDDADLADAVDGLRRVCFKAIGSLSAPGDRPPLVYVPEIELWMTTDRENTAIFIEDRILELLQPYLPLSERQVLILALRAEFKNLPRAIHLDLIDLVRKQYTDKAQALNFLSFDASPDLLNAAEHAGVPAYGRSAKNVIVLLTVLQEELVESLEARNYQALLAVADYAQDDDFPNSKQSRKSGVTNAIARLLGVGLRQARHRKKKLHEATTRALKDEGSVMSEIFEALCPSKPNVPSRRRCPADQEGEYSEYFPGEKPEPLEASESVAEEDEAAAVLAEIPE